MSFLLLFLFQRKKRGRRVSASVPSWSKQESGAASIVKKKRKEKKGGYSLFARLKSRERRRWSLSSLHKDKAPGVQQASRSPAGLLSAKQSASRRQRNRIHIDNLEKKHKRKNYKIFNPPPKKRKYSEYTV